MTVLFQLGGGRTRTLSGGMGGDKLGQRTCLERLVSNIIPGSTPPPSCCSVVQRLRGVKGGLGRVTRGTRILGIMSIRQCSRRIRGFGRTIHGVARTMVLPRGGRS